MAVFIYDFGDQNDPIKWDFPEYNIPIYIIGKYPYKAKNQKNAEKLFKIRNQINELCQNLTNNKNDLETDKSNCVNLFLEIHNEYHYNPSDLPEPFSTISLNGLNTSRYLLSEIPSGTNYSGLNKPKMRFNDPYAPSIGKDGQARALYRDVFLDLNLSPKELEKLVIHELSHTMANHVFYRPDDHHADFKWCEKLITKHWPFN
jgi:hypothetical protein